MATTVPDVVGVLGAWSSAGSGPLARRLAHTLRTAVLTGALAPGSRLPAERPLAAGLAVSRATLVAALDELRADGIVTSRRGSGTVVAGRARGDGARPTRASMVDHLLAHGGIDLAVAAPADAGHLPDLVLTTADLLGALPAHGYEPAGLPALRAALAEHLGARDRPSAPDEVHVTQGAQHGLALALGALVGPGDAVVVGEPTYPGVLDVLAALGAAPVPVGGDAHGPDPAALARVLRAGARVAYLQPVVDNPTGRVVPPGRRDALAAVLDEHEAAVVEDLALAELAHAGPAGPGLGARCRRATVASVGSLGKVAWGGLRIGWIRAPAALVERTVRARHASDLGVAVPAQLLALRLVPDLDALAAARRRHLAERLAVARTLLREHLPTWTCPEPAGGLALWVRLPTPDAGALVQLARRHGVRVAPGSAAMASAGPDPHLRVCFDRPDAQLAEGVRRLAAAWAELSARGLAVLA